MFYFMAALIGFFTATSYAPGPSNLTLMATGSQLGFRKSLPAIFGYVINFPAVITVVGLSLGFLGAYETIIVEILTPGAIVFLLYLAYRTATLPIPSQSSLDARAGKGPATFWSLSLFQWINPWAWALALAVHSIYLPLGVAAGLSPTEATIMIGFLVFPFVLSSGCTWTAMGKVVAHILHNRPRLFRIFNVFLAGLLLASLIPLIKELLYLIFVEEMAGGMMREMMSPGG